MNPDFIRIKAFEGELKLAQIKSQFGCSITTKELIFQKPHHSYLIRLSDIISMVPYQVESKSVAISSLVPKEERVMTSFGTNYYKISTDKVKIFNRNGMIEKGQTDFIVPLSKKMLDHVAAHSNLMIFT